MKFKSLLDIPDGYEMELAERIGKWEVGTKIVRGHSRGVRDDEGSVAFTFPDVDYCYLIETDIREIESKSPSPSPNNLLTHRDFGKAFVEAFQKTENPNVTRVRMIESENVGDLVEVEITVAIDTPELCEFHDSDQAACQQYSGSAPCEPAPAQDERKVVETVPHWKFHALVEHCKKQDQLISDLYARLNSVRLYDEKEVWFWQGDGCDHLESLACPVVIEADELRRLVNAAPIAQTAPQPEQSGLVEALEEIASGLQAEFAWEVAEQALSAYRAALSAQEK